MNDELTELYVINLTSIYALVVLTLYYLRNVKLLNFTT